MPDDEMLCGILAGILANIPKLIVAWTMYLLGWVPHILVHVGAGLFVAEKYIHTPLGVLLGSIVDFAISGLVGIILVLVARWTSPRLLWLKGLCVGFGMFVFAYGVVTSSGLTTVDIRTPLPNLLAMIPHLIIATTAGWIIQKYGDIEEA